MGNIDDLIKKCEKEIEIFERVSAQNGKKLLEIVKESNRLEKLGYKEGAVQPGAVAEIKVCPFCKQPGKIIERDIENTMYGEERFDIGCGTHGCYLQHGAEYWHTREKIIELWNKRATASL